MTLKMVTEMKTGLRFYAGPSFGDKQMAIRDWTMATDKKKLAESEFSMTDLPWERISSGVHAVRRNMPAIKASKTVSDLSFSQDGVILCGAGYSLNLLDSLGDDFALHGMTTIAINRAIHAFYKTEKLDYAFICDSRASLCGEGWLDTYEPGRARLIASTDADPVFVEKPFEERYFFEVGMGGQPEWKAENKDVNLPILDAGFCGLFSMLHLCRNVWKAGRGPNKVFLLGHDFALVNNHKYFDTPYRVSPDQSDPGYDFCAMEDGRGNLVFSQTYLVQQALLITFLCSILVAEGMEITIIGRDGCLVDPVFSRLDP